MFTGIITDIGTILSIEKKGDIRARIKTSYDMGKVAIGASIACSGVCLTVVAKEKNAFSVDISEETLSRTNISTWRKGTKINLERALCLGDEFGGHIVSGHVDGMATVQNIKIIGDSHQFTFKVPAKLAIYIAEKGSVTLDGVSLTVNKVKGNNFTVNIIPHTWKATTFSNLKKNDKVNVEVDMLARYVLRAIEYKK